MTQQSDLGYIQAYRLTPLRAGEFTLPAFTLTVEGQNLTTEPVTIRVRPPAETDSMKLRASLSAETAYVGEPVTLTLTWYVAQEVREYQITSPILTHAAFAQADPPVNDDGSRRLQRMAINGQEVVGEEGQAVLDGRTYTTYTLRKVLIPREAGTYAVEPTLIVCNTVIGYREGAHNSAMPGGDFFAGFPFGPQRQAVVKGQVVPSNPLTLTVRDVPAEGRPAHFAGHVGRYHIEATASPTEVNVGDPITLTLTLSGPDYLETAAMPALAKQPAFAEAFKIPADAAAPRIEGNRKVFSQTIRATRADVTAIPAIELPYFDTASGQYQVARTDPIPLTVHETKVLTAQDAEGHEIAAAASRSLEAWRSGIAHNVEGPQLLVNRSLSAGGVFRSPRWAALLAAPPLVYFALWAGLSIRRRRDANPAATRARRAFTTLNRDVAAARGDAAALLAALTRYLGDRLNLPAAALTYPDIAAALGKRGMAPGSLAALKDVFGRLEEARYAGGLTGSASAALADQLLAAAGDLERSLR